VKLLLVIIAGAAAFWFLAVISYKYFGFALDAKNVVLTLVGILATFVVVSNYMQVQEVKKEFESKVGETRKKIWNVEKGLKKIEETKREIRAVEVGSMGLTFVTSYGESKKFGRLIMALVSFYKVVYEFNRSTYTDILDYSFNEVDKFIDEAAENERITSSFGNNNLDEWVNYLKEIPDTYARKAKLVAFLTEIRARNNEQQAQ
jgi:hypothetical protein